MCQVTTSGTGPCTVTVGGRAVNGTPAAVPVIGSGAARPSTLPQLSLDPLTVNAAQAADQLAQAVLTTWRQEAADRRITTPAPVRVRWYWSLEQASSSHHSAWELVPGAVPAPFTH